MDIDAAIATFIIVFAVGLLILGIGFWWRTFKRAVEANRPGWALFVGMSGPVWGVLSAAIFAMAKPDSRRVIDGGDGVEGE